MTTKEFIALAKARLGLDISEQEAQDYLDGKKALPDEALELVSGGENTGACPMCGEINYCYDLRFGIAFCGNCAHEIARSKVRDGAPKNKCSKCGMNALYYRFNDEHVVCTICGHSEARDFIELF